MEEKLFLKCVIKRVVKNKESDKLPNLTACKLPPPFLSLSLSPTLEITVYCLASKTFYGSPLIRPRKEEK